MARRHFLGVALCTSLALAAPRARAGGDPTVQARALAQEAGDLLDAKKYADALDRVMRAEALYHAPTHELMMGQAQEGLGHPAAALAIFEKLAAEPIPAAAPHAFVEAQQAGKERLRALLARVPSLLVVVRGLRPGQHADVRVDGEPFAIDAAAARPADPGSHVVIVSVEGRDPVQQTVVLPDKGGVVTAEVSMTPSDSHEAVSAPQAPPPALPSVLVEQAAPAPHGGGGSLVPAFVAFGVGAVGLGVGAVTGALSLSNVSDLRSRCPGNVCPSSQQSEVDSTRMLGTVSTVGFIVGGVGAAAGAVLLLLRKPSVEASSAHGPRTVGPWVGAGAAGVEGTFW
jgi:hypothetical protein